MGFITVGNYAKFLVALGGLAGVISSALADGSVSTPEITAIVSAAVAAVLVLFVSNAPASTNAS